MYMCPCINLQDDRVVTGGSWSDSYVNFTRFRNMYKQAIGMASGRTGGGAIAVLCPLHRATQLTEGFIPSSCHRNSRSVWKGREGTPSVSVGRTEAGANPRRAGDDAQRCLPRGRFSSTQTTACSAAVRPYVAAPDNEGTRKKNSKSPTKQNVDG